MTKTELSDTLRRLAGIPPWSSIPDSVLDSIVEDIREAAKTKEITKPIIVKIVGQYIENAGSYKEAGEDFSLINSVLVAIQNIKPRR